MPKSHQMIVTLKWTQHCKLSRAFQRSMVNFKNLKYFKFWHLVFSRKKNSAVLFWTNLKRSCDVRHRFICSRNLSRKIEKIDTISNVRTHTALTLSWLRLDPLVVVAVVVLVAPPWLALESFEEAPMVLRGDSMASLEALHNWHSYRIMRNGQKDEWWPPKSTCQAQLIDGAKYKINGSFEKIFLATNDGTKSRSEKRGPKGHRSNKKLCPFYQW